MAPFVDDTVYVDWSTRIVFYALVAVVSGLWMIHRWQQQSRLFRLGNVLPGPEAVPFFGNALLALGKKPDQLVNVALEYAERYGTVIRGWLGTKLIVFLLDPEDIEVILNSQVHIDKAPEYRFFKPWLGEGLLISTGNKWRSHRKMIAPTFHINILKSFVGVFNQNSKHVVEKLRKEVGKTFDVHDYMSTATVDILLETAMGITRKTQDESGFDYAMAVMKMCDIIHQRHYKFWLRFDTIFKFSSFFEKQKQLLGIIHGLTTKVIKNKKQTYFENKDKGIIPPTLAELTRNEEDGSLLANDAKTLSDAVFKGYRDDLDFNDENDVGEKKRLAFLDLMIESAQNGTHQLTDHEIKEEVDTIMFEGHDTTAAGSSFVLCLLGIYKDIQAKVYNELYDIFVTNNYLIPAGTTVVIGTYKVHRSPKHYKDPDTFNPDNFLPENMANRHYYSYIPFSAGPRSCVGRKYALLKLKILLSTILRNYECTSTVPEKDFKLLGDIILKRSDGFRLQIEPRIRKPTNIA
ncbi:hypothetical protein HF086_011655 [Spodoptera exigua]|uniref:Cytochrome p450 n=1 Tax=Spodoptera exigua TaxID=7107 RepID=A0A922MQX9_SPOEX|nr:hypothetical protein HF086_011655 [Spodoptera exigua]